jgi:hypothetical protein
MADDKTIEAALARIAAMESELSGYRSKAKEPPPKQFDPSAFVKAFIDDPISVMQKMGVPKEHVTKILVADALGKDAPPALQMQRHMGAQINTTTELSQKLDDLSRRLEALSDKDARQGTRESLNKLISDKSKYPHLATALAKDPSFFDDDIASHKGDAEALATTLEARSAKYAGVLGAKVQPASVEKADQTEPKDQYGKPATVGSTTVDVPPIPQKQQGAWTEDDDRTLRDEMVRKYQPSS